MAMIIDVSESLDVLGYRQGDVLFRGTKFWERIPIGPAGQVLTSDGQRPLWQEGGGGGSAGGMVSVRPRPFFTWTSGSVYGGNSCGLTAGYAEYEQQISALRAACSQAAVGQLIAPVIYADNNGSPGALIVQGDFVPLIGGDIVTMPLNAPLTLAEGQRVWIGVYVRGAGSCYFYTCGIAFPQRFFAWTSPALPSVAIPTQGGNSNNSTWWCV